MGNGNIPHTKFQHLLYQIFVYEKKYAVEDACRLIGVKPRSFYDYLEGVRYFPPDLAPVLFIATVHLDILRHVSPAGEMRLLTFFTEGTGYEAVPVDRADDHDPLCKDLLDIAATLGKLVPVIQRAVRDGHVSERESADISALCTALIQEVEGVRAKTKPGRKA